MLTYGDMIERIADRHARRPARVGARRSRSRRSPSVVAAAVAGEDAGLIGPLMESLEHDLLPRDDDAAAAFGVRLHRFDAAVERALRELEPVRRWPMGEPVVADIDIDAPPERCGRWYGPPPLRRLGDDPPKASTAPTRARRARACEMEQTLCLRGAVQGEVDAWRRPRRPAPRRVGGPRARCGSHARTEYRSPPTATAAPEFHYSNEFSAPGGRSGAAAGRVLVGGMPEREAERSLQRLKALVEDATGTCCRAAACLSDTARVHCHSADL